MYISERLVGDGMPRTMNVIPITLENITVRVNAMYIL